ncbi:LEAF RUST 10 DISEASE-RESISTANCE LOCUS RECEPTOR-LIKE PROTEIN KINASE-like 2.4 [Panicum virgatum]|nr:LEAF RUST 10 DISEASE-RESISTANCE LOCUS RECEPTOR-LIKE PROTEIN KINASE-like 2.4 [Panicum virgatum]
MGVVFNRTSWFARRPATIRIGSGTYNVLSINYTGSYFWVVDANLNMQNSCPLPPWDYGPYYYHYHDNSLRSINQDPGWPVALFMNCSQEIKYDYYSQPVKCLSTVDSFIYMSIWSGVYNFVVEAQYFAPSCSFLAMTPLGGPGATVPENASYPDVVKLMGKGFALEFPFMASRDIIRECLAELKSDFRYYFHNESTEYQIWDILATDTNFWSCVTDEQFMPAIGVTNFLRLVIIQTLLFVMLGLKLIHVFCRYILVPLAVFAFLAHRYWKSRITINAVERFLRMQQIMLVTTRYAYADIIAITGHFREKLGQGGYGSVYKGVLLPGGVPIAVKMLSNSSCNGEEFISEVATIGKIHHVNVVRLVGFCSEETVRALIYEFMPRGSLDKYIFSSEKSFSWDKLNEIALGIARGINYMHQGCDMQIVHFDIKPHNILLDSNFVPKVADFGLAKLFPKDNSFVPLSAMRGTIGYIAPEMVSRSFGAISSKSDVYSFGMLLLEMDGGRRNADPHAGSSSQAYYPSLVYGQLTGEQVGEISEDVNMHELEKKLCVVGLWCIQMKPSDRPTMSEVIEMLEGDAGALQMPPRPFFCDEEMLPEVAPYSLSSELNVIEEEDE